MYKSRRRIIMITLDCILAVSFIVLALFLLPQVKVNDFRDYNLAFPLAVSGILFFSLLLIFTNIFTTLKESLEKKSLETGETSYLTEFINRLRFCYSLDDFYGVISSVLEKKCDCSVLYVDTVNNYILYNSPNRLTMDKKLIDRLLMDYSHGIKNGFYYMGDDFGLISKYKKSRGFFLKSNGQQFYVFCRYSRLFDKEVFPTLFEEFQRFQTRVETISALSEIAGLTKEWEQLADAQVSFLPHGMPDVKRVTFGAYYRPLVNVSGDYYTVLPIDEDKTLIMLGDVSGKGLAAALVMGLVMNTVKIRENKEDLIGMVEAIDTAIKGMALQDKYTVVFLGIIDTKKMIIKYINASMSDPIIVTRSPDGRIIKPLSSNCSIVGILPLEDLRVSEQRLFSGDLILMASDGISEVMNDEGVELGDTKLFIDTIKTSADKTPQEFIKDMESMIFEYNGNKKLRDDVTMLVAKIKG